MKYDLLDMLKELPTGTTFVKCPDGSWSAFHGDRRYHFLRFETLVATMLRTLQEVP